MTAFRYLAPRTVEEAVEALATHPGSRVLAGGTDLMVALRAGKIAPCAVVDVTSLPELREIREEVDGSLLIGAAVPHAVLAGSALVRRLAPALGRASSMVGSVQIRNLGTVGGNAANASVAGDTLPALAALEATFEVAGPAGRRSLSVGDFFRAPGRTALAQADVLTAIRVPRHPEHGCGFLKVGRRRAVAISRLSVAVLANPSMGFARVAVGAVFPKPTRLTEAEEALRRGFDEEAVREAGRAAEAAVRAVSGGRASMAYKLPVVRAAVARTAKDALAGREEGP